MENEKPSWQECLELLLAMPIGGGTLKDAAPDAIVNAGLPVENGRLIVSHNNPVLSEYFQRTSYRGGIWVTALRGIPPEIGEVQEYQAPDRDPAGLRPPVMKTRYRVLVDKDAASAL